MLIHMEKKDETWTDDDLLREKNGYTKLVLILFVPTQELIIMLQQCYERRFNYFKTKLLLFWLVLFTRQSKLTRLESI